MTLMALDTELATFERLKADMLKNHSGKFALIKGDNFIGAFDSPENAYTEGVGRFGNEPFLVKRISEHEEVYRNYALYSGLMNARIRIPLLDPANGRDNGRRRASHPGGNQHADCLGGVVRKKQRCHSSSNSGTCAHRHRGINLLRT